MKKTDFIKIYPFNIDIEKTYEKKYKVFGVFKYNGTIKIKEFKIPDSIKYDSSWNTLSKLSENIEDNYPTNIKVFILIKKRFSTSDCAEKYPYLDNYEDFMWNSGISNRQLKIYMGKLNRAYKLNKEI